MIALTCSSPALAQQVNGITAHTLRVTVSSFMPEEGWSLSGWVEVDTPSINNYNSSTTTLRSTLVLRKQTSAQAISKVQFELDASHYVLSLPGIDLTGTKIGNTGLGVYSVTIRYPGGTTKACPATMTLTAEDDQPCTLTHAKILKDNTVELDYTLSAAWSKQPVSFTAFLSATPDGNPYDASAWVKDWQRISDPNDPRLSEGEHKHVRVFEGGSPLTADPEHPYVIIESNYVAIVMDRTMDRRGFTGAILTAVSHESKLSTEEFRAVLLPDFLKEAASPQTK